MSYAKGTTVSVPKTRIAIEATLRKHKADNIVTGWSGETAYILFELMGRKVRFTLGMIPANGLTTVAKVDAENRRRWRCLLLIIKAKFEAVESNIVRFDEEFLAHILIPGSKETVGDWVGPQLMKAYERGGAMPPLLGAGDGR